MRDFRTHLNKKSNDLLDELAIALPHDVENMQLPDPTLVTFYRDLENRIIWLDDNVTEDVLELSKLIMAFNREDKKNNIPVDQRKPIKIMIFSYGGDLNACYNFIDTILLSKTPVYTYNMGVAMSAGLLILLAGHKRACLKDSTALIHKGSGQLGGNADAAMAQAEDYKHALKVMEDYILERTSIPKATFNKKKSKEWYIYADEQVELGIVNSIVTDMDELY